MRGRHAPHEPAEARSICDALQSSPPGKITFAINRKLLAGILTVSDAEVETAMATAFRHLRLVVEPGGAVALAAALAGRIELCRPDDGDRAERRQRRCQRPSSRR